MTDKTASSEATATDDEVTPVELLYDVVFAFALSQLSQHLLEDLSWVGAAQTAVLLIAVFSTWALVSFSASVPGVSRRVEVWLLLTATVLGLVFNAGISFAFTDQPWLFVVPLLACVYGLASYYGTLSSSDFMRGQGRNMLVWFLPSSVLLVVGGFTSTESRLLWWAPAVLVGVVGQWSGYRLPGRGLRTETVPFEPSHMLERSRLFLIIALGETVLTTGAALASTTLDGSTVAAAVTAAAGTVALWGLYFAGSDRLITDHADSTGNPLRAAMLSINGQVVTAAGLITVAVGYELAVHDPWETAGTTGALLLFGGPILYLGLQVWYLWSLTGRLPRSRAVGVVVMAILGAGAWALPNVVALFISSTVLVGLALWAARAVRRAAGETH